MASVVLLKGLNVGGHRRFRPSALARQLHHLQVVSIGAAGSFVVRAQVRHEELRAEIARRLPLEAEIVICRGRDVASLLSEDFFAAFPERPEIVRFVSVLARAPRSTVTVPAAFPPQGRWIVKALARRGRFVVGLHRREMSAIGALGRLERFFGVPLTTRSWSTMNAIGRALEAAGPGR